MNEKDTATQQVVSDYHSQAPRYDTAVHRFDLFARFGFSISAWRAAAIASLNLQPGEAVVDLGCGTGLNFPQLYTAVGPEGSIIGVDLSPAMLEQARTRVAANGWSNVQLVCADAAEFAFPPQVSAVLSTFTLILVPNCRQAVGNACRAVGPGGRLAILDMAWPRYCPLWWRHVLFFLRAYGVTAGVLRQKPWEAVQQEMQVHLSNISRHTFWFGFFYLWSGSVVGHR